MSIITDVALQATPARLLFMAGSWIRLAVTVAITAALVSIPSYWVGKWVGKAELRSAVKAAAAEEKAQILERQGAGALKQSDLNNALNTQSDKLQRASDAKLSTLERQLKGIKDAQNKAIPPAGTGNGAIGLRLGPGSNQLLPGVSSSANGTDETCRVELDIERTKRKQVEADLLTAQAWYPDARATYYESTGKKDGKASEYAAVRARARATLEQRLREFEQ